MGAYSVIDLSIRGLGEPRHAKTAIVTPSFFEVLRVAPRVGRAPSTSDPDDWMILASTLANTAGGSGGSGAASALGKPATAGERGLQVSGVMPPEFALPADDVAAWLPAQPFARVKLGQDGKCRGTSGSWRGSRTASRWRRRATTCRERSTKATRSRKTGTSPW